MALKIKKQIKNPDGTMTEIEGTEAEVEAFLRKAQKQNETAEKAERKKNLILGKSEIDQIEALIKHYIAIHEITKMHNGIVHHWHHNNGWWYQPIWVGGSYTYAVTNTDPNIGNAGKVFSLSSAADVAGVIGCSVEDINTNTVTSNGIATNTAAVNSLRGDIVGTYAAALSVDNTLLDVNNMTSGIINMNIKS